MSAKWSTPLIAVSLAASSAAQESDCRAINAPRNNLRPHPPRNATPRPGPPRRRTKMTGIPGPALSQREPTSRLWALSMTTEG